MKQTFSTISSVIFAFLVLSAVNAYAEDTTVIPADWTAVKYNDGVRYSQWVIDSRISDFRANAKERGFNAYDVHGRKIRNSLGASAFDYVPGLVAKAIIEAAAYYDSQSWARPWYYSVESYANSCYDSAPSIGKSQDDMNAAKMYFPLRDLANGAYKKYADSQTVSNADWAISNIGRAFKDLNKHYAIQDTTLVGAAGGWWHKGSYTDQMWCDGLYMGAALLAQMINYQKAGYVTGAADTDWDLLTKQFDISWSYLWDKDKKLLWHAFTADPENKASKDWAGIGQRTLPDGKQTIVFHSAAYWGRACGWYFLALDDILEQMQIAGLQNTANYAKLKGYLNALAEGLAERQDKKSGCWYQLLDETDDFVATQYRGKTYPATRNYLESSCTSIFTAAYIKGIRLGLLNKARYESVAKAAYKGSVDEFMMQQPDGTVQLVHNCASAGLGAKDQRDGSKEYYLLGPDVPQRNTYTEGKVLGGFVLAATEYERMYQADKAIMLSADLLPSYAVGSTLAVKAMGNDGITPQYQWYYAKNAKQAAKGKYKPLSPAVDAVTSATARPADSTSPCCGDASPCSTITASKPGYYYCTATANGTTLTTRVTVVE